MPKTCLKCKHIADGDPVACPACSAIYAKLEEAVQRGEVIRSIRPVSGFAKPSEQPRTTDEALARARITGNWKGVPAEIVRSEADNVLFATSDSLPGHQIQTTLGLVSADFAYAFGAVGETLAGLARNIAGSGKSEETVRLMQEGRGAVLQSLRFQALDMGADAVVAVRFDYEEFSGANQRGVLVVTGTGTAVRRQS